MSEQNVTPTHNTTQTVASPAVPDAHPGQAVFETNSEVALPDVTVNVYHQFPSGGVLHGMVVDEGGELQKIIAGNQNIVPGPDGTWPWGVQISPGAYCIAIIKNTSKDTKALKGAFLVSPGGPQNNAGPNPGSLTSPHVAAAPVAMPGGHGASASPRAPASASATVTPGSNEIAVLLPYGEAKRLLDIVNGAQQQLTESEKAGVARAFHHAFQRSGMG